MKKKLSVLFVVSILILQILMPTITYAQEASTATTNSEKTSTTSELGKVSSSILSSEENKTTESSKSTEQSNENKPVTPKKTKAAISDNIFTSIKMYKINGDEIQPTDTIPNMSGIKLTMNFSFANKNYQAGDTFTTQLPTQLAIAKDLSGDFSPMTSAKWSISAATKELTITFLEDNVSSENYDLTLVTSLEKISGVDEESQKIVFDTTPQQTIYTLEMTSSIDKGKTTTTITSDTLNPKTAQINSVFNLDRTDNTNRRYQIYVNNNTSKLNYDEIKVYSSDVDFNGTIVGSKTLLKQDEDYQITYKGNDTSQATADITLLKSIGKKAIVTEATISGIDGKNYVDDGIAGYEYNYLYNYAYTYENETQVNSAFASKTFVTLQPLQASGKINQETGMIDWEIKYNFNQQPLTSTSKLITNLADQGVEMVDGSLDIQKVDLNYTSGNSYDVQAKGDGSGDFDQSANTDGSLTLTTKANTTQAYIIKYSTKITDPTERIIKNKVTNGTINKEVQVSLIPNLLTKEAGKIDIFDRTMEWSITVNAEKYTMKNPVVHDYFIGAVKDYSGVTISKKISETESTPLVEGVDYKVTKFDENGSPVGAQPNVNGAPDSFNGGIRIDFLGDYQNLKDTLVITIKTKIDSSGQKTEVKNKATLNYGDVPGVVEYEAKGTFTDPYYTGATKIGQTSNQTSEKYLYQDWLVFLNSKGSDFNLTKLEDTLPAGTELVPDSLRFEEVTSQSMIENMANYLSTDYKLVPEGSDAYPTKIDIKDNQMNLEFANLGSKRVYVKYRTRVKKDWYVYQKLDNVAKVTYDDKAPIDLKYSVYAYNYQSALQKAVAKDATKENVANWTITTKNISTDLPVNNPEITDTLTQGTTNATYDPTSFVVTDTATGEKIGTEHYRLTISGNSFKINFLDYQAESNIQVTYNTVSEFPGAVKNLSQVNSASYGGLGTYYRQSTATVNLSFTSGSGSGVIKTDNLSVLKVNDKDEPLAGATFEILKADGTETGLKADTDENGELTFEGLPLDNYLLKETKAPNGYEINPDYQEGKAITLTEKMAAIKVVNQATVPNSVELTKVDQISKEGLAGAKFQLEKSDGTIISSDHETGTDGRFTVKDLPIGKYQFIETQAPDGYKLDQTPVTFAITERQGQVVNLEKENTLLTGSVILNKVDEQTKEPLKGAIFQLKNKQGIVLKSELATDGSGQLKVEDLAPGDYQFIETKAPTGYQLDQKEVEFTIAKGQDKTIVVEKTNIKTPDPGTITLTKTDEETGEALAGATFKLQDSAGKDLQTYLELVTDKSGKISFETLPAGSYQLIETKAPTGYQEDNKPVKFTVTDPSETIELAKTNKKVNQGVILEKVDELTGQPLSGATFVLQTQEGKTIKTEKMTTDDNGRLAVDELPPGNYQFVEKEAPKGYELDEKPVTFTIKSKQDQAVQVKKTNKQISSSVLMKKVDSVTGEGLANAQFTLQDQAGKTIKENLVSDEDGKLLIEKLAVGKYQLVETKAPLGYKLDSQPIDFEITTKKFDMINLTKENQKEQPTKKDPANDDTSKKSLLSNTSAIQSAGRNHTYLPKTGNSSSPILIVIGTIILLILAAFTFYKKKYN
ncbi:SpaA isopeptide-forming pilin-related protein [Enterococcus alishanensis]|uniref:LPXTG cell wall anchor domain-containing protein n=1 Tax=Enterococcus alishanensis TaxID=1303817 RepID=A0ABS6TA04_9ENTE|nr:SpaA isopeptide-forming pilin-related protein [Enterococcus alishanensis]MBV7389720.1 LPXTG cell wall anchor domain-containing protein [Enterococcus alishanensis]